MNCDTHLQLKFWGRLPKWLDTWWLSPDSSCGYKIHLFAKCLDILQLSCLSHLCVHIRPVHVTWLWIWLWPTLHRFNTPVWNHWPTVTLRTWTPGSEQPQPGQRPTSRLTRWYSALSNDKCFNHPNWPKDELEFALFSHQSRVTLEGCQFSVANRV